MLPKYVKVQNFTSYIDETIKFEDFGELFAVIGENGAGKSSLIDMITTALFYRARGVDSRGTGMEELINQEADHFEIEFVFTMNKVEYKIVRRKFRDGAHELEFYIDGVSHTEKITETQAKIDDVIKMDYDTFLDTVCIGQGQSGRFMNKKPNERKDVFVQVLGLNKYEKLEAYTKDLRKDTKNEIEKINDRLSLLQTAVSMKDNYEQQRIDGEEQIRTLKVNIRDKEAELEKVVKEKAQYEHIKQQRDHILSQRNSLEQKIKTTTASLNTDKTSKVSLESQITDKATIQNVINDLKEHNEKLQNSVMDLSNQKSTLEATNNMLSTQAKEFKTKYTNLKDYNQAQCNFCGHDITEKYKEQYLKDLITEGKKYLNQISSNKEEIEKLDAELKLKNQKLTSNKSELRAKETELSQINTAEMKLNSVNTRIVELEKNLVEYKKEYDINLEIQVDELEEKTFNDGLLKTQISQLRQQLSALESKVAIAKNELVNIKNSEKEIADLEKQVTKLQVLYDDYDSLVTAYSKSGIQAVIIANALPEIEEEINKLLEILCNGSVNIEFRTEKDKKTKKKNVKPASIETLDIIINDEKGSRTYETYSGGEKFRVDFACHVGLAKFLAKRAGATIDFFVVDEGLGSQDENARHQFVYSVYKLTNTFEQVMVVTHIEELKDAFKNKVLVSKDPINGSKVQLLIS